MSEHTVTEYEARALAAFELQASAAEKAARALERIADTLEGPGGPAVTIPAPPPSAACHAPVRVAYSPAEYDGGD